MHQLTLRIDEALADQLKDEAARRDESVNSYASAVLSAALDPELAAGELERIRARLDRAGLLARPNRAVRARQPSAERLARARRAAAKGSSLSDFVSEGRN